MRLEKSNYLLQHSYAVGIFRRGLQFRMGNFHFIVKSACVIQHFHEDAENFGRISFLEMMFDDIDVLIEVFENM